MTEDEPAYLYCDQTLALAVDHLTRLYLENIVAEAAQAISDWDNGDYVEYPSRIPTLDPDRLKLHLASMLEIADKPSHLNTYKAGLIAAKVIALETAQARLDAVMEQFLDACGIISPGMLYVNDPSVMDVVQRRPPAQNEILLVPLGDFYEEEQIDGDDRRDALIGVMQWSGFYLCRPALVSLPSIEDKLSRADQEDFVPKRPNVMYAASYGAH